MPPEIAHADKEALVNVLAKWSEEEPPVTARPTSRTWSSRPISPPGSGPDYSRVILVTASSNARHLVNLAITIGTNSNDGNSALGSIIDPLIGDAAGVEDSTLFASVIVAYGLVKSKSRLDELRMRYQIPERPAAVPAVAPVVVGPPVTWAGETKQLELQGWFTPDPEWLEVALLLNATDRARSVCRVEIGGVGRGTGVLIRPDLVLTNYHVMGNGTLDAPAATLAANASDTVLRFGAFTAQGPAAAGQEVRLRADQPVEACSPQYDFALLRTDKSVARAVDVRPFGTPGRVPVKRNPLYVLQHPQGGTMKLALVTSGVSWVDPAQVTVEYTTKVAPGSSGSPCFDSDWNLVALHHARRRRQRTGHPDAVDLCAD